MGKYLKLAQHKNEPDDYKRANELRKRAPLAEQLLWNKLRSLHAVTKIRFRRQHALHPYTVDFACLKARLVIELDGSSHDSSQIQDRERDNYLRGLGYTVLRFGNDDVMKNCEGVALTIINKVEELMSPPYAPLPQPLPQGEGSAVGFRGKGHIQ